MLNHDEQREQAAFLICELYDSTETWEDRGISWNRLGRLMTQAKGNYGELKELLHIEFGTSVHVG